MDFNAAAIDPISAVTRGTPPPTEMDTFALELQDILKDGVWRAGVETTQVTPLPVSFTPLGDVQPLSLSGPAELRERVITPPSEIYYAMTPMIREALYGEPSSAV